MEYFTEAHTSVQETYTPNQDRPVKSYLDYLASNSSIEGLLAVKLLWGHIEQCCKYPDFVEEIKGRKIIVLRRNDIVRQGVSLYLAKLTGQWVASRNPSLMQPEEVPYDYHEIDKRVKRLSFENMMITRFLLAFDLDYTSVWYEDFLRSYDDECSRILAYLGLSPAEGPIATNKPFQKQSTLVSDRFYQQYVADERARLCKDGSFRGKPLFPETPMKSNIG